MKLLGLDVGTKRIGVARVDSNVKISVPLGTLEVDGTEMEKLKHLANVHSVQVFVVGLPRNSKGEETAQSKYSRDFAQKLQTLFPDAKIYFEDESLTSVEAEIRLKSRKKSFEKGEVDSEAATIILQSFIDNLELRLSSAQSAQPTKLKKTKNLKRFFLFLGSIFVLIVIFFGGVFIYNRYLKKPEPVEIPTVEVFNFTILPGETLSDVKQKFRDLGYDELEIEEAFSKDYDHPVLASKPADSSLEGYLYGETYEFYVGESV